MMKENMKRWGSVVLCVGLLFTNPGMEQLTYAASAEAQAGMEETGMAEGMENPEEDAENEDMGETVPDHKEVLEEENPGDETPVSDGEEESDRAEITLDADGNIASGSVDINGHIDWVIDANGRLTVEGTGEISDGTEVGSVSWKSYRDDILSAEISITGITNASYLLYNCVNLKSVDLSRFDTSNVIHMRNMFSGCENLTNLDVSHFDTSNVIDMGGMFYSCKSLMNLDVSQFNTNKVTDMGNMFSWCNGLTNLDVSKFDTSKVRSMSGMFFDCYNLANLDVSKFDTGNVRNMSDMFFSCRSLINLDVSHFDTSKVTQTYRMFLGCENLVNLDVSHFDMSNVTDMNAMFEDCSSLTNLDVSHFDTSKVVGEFSFDTGMSNMFNGCSSLTNLDVSNFDTSNVTNMESMFAGCENLTNLDVSHFVTSNVKNMRNMFHFCNALKNLDVSHFDTRNVTNMSGMFFDCESLTNLDVGQFNTSNATDMSFMFGNCVSLTNLDVSKFDTRNVIDMYGMFGNSSLTELDLSSFDVSKVVKNTLFDECDMISDCSNLSIIHTPYNLSISVSLPTESGDVWYRSDGTTVTELPQNLSYSVVLGRNHIPGENQTEASQKLRVTMTRNNVKYNLLEDKQFFSKASSEKVSVSVSADWGEASPGMIALVQDGRTVLQDSKGSFTNIEPSKLFEVNKSIYVVLTDADNKETARRKLLMSITPISTDRLQHEPSTIRLIVYQNKKKSKTINDDYEVAKNATVILDKTCKWTNDKGIVQIPYMSSGSVTIEKENYITRTLTAEQLAESTSVYLQQKPDGAPVVFAVWIENTDVLTHTCGLNMLDKSPRTLTAEVDWGDSSMGSIKLVQDARSVAFEGNTLTTVISDKFDTSEKLYIVAVDAEGKSTKKELKFDNAVKPKAVRDLDEAAFSVGDGIDVQLSEDFKPKLFAGEKLGVNVESATPVTVSAENGKIKVSIGVDLISYSYSNKSTTNSDTKNTTHVIKREVKTFIDKLKDTEAFDKEGTIKDDQGTASADTSKWDSCLKKLENINRTYRNAIKCPQGKFGVDADFTVLGFAEGCYDENGTITWLDGGVILNPSVSVKKDLPFLMPFVPVPVPMFFETSFSAKVLAQLNLIFNETAKNFMPDGEISGTIAISGDLNVGVNHILYGGGGLEGKLKPEWRIYIGADDHFKLTATLNAYVKGGIVFFEGKHPFDPIYDEIWIDYPSGRTAASSLENVGTSGLYDASNYELKDLSYLNGSSEFTEDLSIDGASDSGGTSIKTNIYRESTPEYVVFDDGRRLAVWLDSKDDNANHICLYYSYYDGSVWSAPALILDDGTTDLCPSIIKVGDTVYVAWQNATKAFTLTDDLTIDDIAPDFDISVAVFNKDDHTFTSETLSSDNLDMLPCVCSDNEGKVCVAWVNNGENDWFGNNQKNSILYSEYDGGSWSTPTAAYDNLYSVGSLSVDYNDGLHFAYALDTDGNINTTDDLRVYEDEKRVSTSGKAESSPMYFNHELYWYTQNNIVNKKMEAKAGNILSDRYRLVELDGTLAAVYPQSKGLCSALVASCFNPDTESWGDARALTDDGSFIGAFSASAAPDGTLELLMNRTEVVGEMTDEEPYGTASLVLFADSPYCDLSLGEPLFDESTFCVNEPMFFTFDLTNNGTQTIRSAAIDIIENGAVISTTNIYDTLVPGDTIEASASFNVSKAVDIQNIEIVAKPNDMTDIDLSNNTQKVILGYEDVSVENVTYGMGENEEIIISADIVNHGYVGKSGIEVALVEGSLDGTVIDTKRIDSIGSMDLDTVSFTVEAKKFGIYYVVITKGDDKYIANNSDFLIVSDKELPEEEYVSVPAASIDSGTRVLKGTKVSLMCDTPDARIYYTLDGTDPTTDSNLYGEAIMIEKDVTIKVFAVKEGYIDSDIVSFVYTVLDDAEDSEDVLPGDIPSDGKIPQGLWIAGIDESYPYTGKAIKPAVRVYDSDKRLKAGRDYGISYKNNTKANNASNARTAPAVVVKGKGNYKGTETAVFKISAADLGSVTAEDLTLAYNDKVQKKVPKVTYNGKKLSNNKDFTVTYPDKGADAYKAEGSYNVVLTGKGNFTGTLTLKLDITNKTLISKAKVAKIPNQPYDGKEKTPALTVTMKETPLTEGTDYTVRYENNTEAGTARVVLTGIGEHYAGTKKVTFKITGTPLKGAVVTGMEGKTYTYDGAEHRPDPTVTLDGKLLTEGTDYKVSYSNNVNAGKATVVVQGIHAYTGTIKKTFRISAYDLNDQEIRIEGPEQKVKYVKGGSKPEIKLTFADRKLMEGKDYKVSYQNNKAVTASGTVKRPKLIIKGKGNFRGTLSKEFNIISKALHDEESPVTLSVADIAFVDKAGKYISKPVLTDADGKKLIAGKDYESAVTYTLENGKVLTDEDTVDAGVNIRVKVVGKGAYYGELETVYRVTKSDFNQAKIRIPAQAYTGKEVTLSEKDITVKIANSTLTPGTDYEIVKGSYKNNVKKGTATVKVVGKGNYGGTKTIKFKIVSKKFVWFWRLF